VPFGVIAANTAVMTADNACHRWTALEYRPSPQTATDGPGASLTTPTDL
jgi:hypothetical protein